MSLPLAERAMDRLVRSMSEMQYMAARMGIRCRSTLRTTRRTSLGSKPSSMLEYVRMYPVSSSSPFMSRSSTYWIDCFSESMPELVFESNTCWVVAMAAGWLVQWVVGPTFLCPLSYVRPAMHR